VYEETSLAAVEAAASGTPTVLAPECEISGLAGSGGGLVVAAHAKAVADGIDTLLGDLEQSKAIGRLAREFVLQRMSASQVAASHERVYKELAK
jgi:glycosyltransferase involved in cell wall biosynthesis